MFENSNVTFSDYGDITNIDKSHEIYIWFYMIPIRPDINSVIKEIEDYSLRLELVISQIPNEKTFLIFSLEDLFSNRWQNSDVRLRNAIQEYNRNIYAISELKSNVKILDFLDFVKKYRESDLIDWKYYYLSNMLINPNLYADFQLWFKRILSAIRSQRKKCLILDLDNTLWGGVLGEDGMEGIDLGNNYPGSAYKDFQESILNTSKNGVILTVCSKNNEKDVFEAWDKHPNMVLRKEHFSAYRINWKEKPDNILELSQELNIGLDSMVFLDDNPAEREFVNSTIPEVIVPILPEKPYQLNFFLKELYEQYFQIYMLTGDDQLKTEQYKSNKSRQIFKKKTTSIGEYLSGLRMELSFQCANDFNISRIAQMTQKTNQFNLTTRRYTEENIRSFLNKGHLIFCASLKDKFGDNGITAACIVELNIEESMARIDTFLVSCRILGRQVEKTFVSLILNELKKLHIKKVEAFFIPSGKNMQVSDFYENYGFKLKKESAKNKEYILEIKQNYEIDKFIKIEMVK